MASRIWSIFVAAVVIVGLPIVASAGVIFDNFNDLNGFAGTGSPQYGGEVTAAPGTPRVVTELDLGFSNDLMGPATGNLQAFLYANDGSGGSPGTLLWQSAVMFGVTINSTNVAIAFIVPSILVPSTFTYTTSIDYLSGNFGFAPASGATVGTFVTPWVGSPGAWISLPPAFEVEARVIAASVPEPPTIVLLALVLAVLVVIKRFNPGSLA